MLAIRLRLFPFGVIAGFGRTGNSILFDGIHYNLEGHRKYYNSVKGAIIAAANKLA